MCAFGCQAIALCWSGGSWRLLLICLWRPCLQLQSAILYAAHFEYFGTLADTDVQQAEHHSNTVLGCPGKTTLGRMDCHARTYRSVNTFVLMITYLIS